MIKKCMLSHDCCFGSWKDPNTCNYTPCVTDKDICPKESKSFKEMLDTAMKDIKLAEDILDAK